MFQKAYFYPLFAILFWAGNVVVSKMASHAISPVAITFYRLVLALAVMSTFVLIPVWNNRHTIKQYWKQLALGGFLSVSLFQFLSYQAASTTTATNMAIVTALIPLLTMILSSVMLKDRLSYGMLFGGALSFYGILYLLSHGSITNIWKQGVHLGDGLMLIAAAGYALYGVLLKRWKMPIPAWQSNFVQSSFAILYIFTSIADATEPTDYSTDYLRQYFFLSIVVVFMDRRGETFRTESQQYFYESIALIYCADCGRFAGRAFADVPLYRRWFNLDWNSDSTNYSETDSIQTSIKANFRLNRPLTKKL